MAKTKKIAGKLHNPFGNTLRGKIFWCIFDAMAMDSRPTTEKVRAAAEILAPHLEYIDEQQAWRVFQFAYHLGHLDGRRRFHRDGIEGKQQRVEADWEKRVRYAKEQSAKNASDAARLICEKYKGNFDYTRKKLKELDW